MYPERGAWCSCWLRVSHEGANHQQGLWSLEAVEHTHQLTHGPVPGPLHWLPGVLTSEQPASPGASTPGGRVSERGSHRCCPAFRSHTATSSCPWSAPAAPGQRGGDCSGSGAPGGQAPGHLAADSHRASSPAPLCLSVPPHRTGVLAPSRELSGGGRHVLRSPILSVNSTDVQKSPMETVRTTPPISAT